MKKILFSLAALSLIATATSYAQERAAAGAIETQMTWTTLNAQVQQANVRIDGVNSRVDQVVVCGKKGKAYAPGGTGADAQGCLEAASNTGVSMTTILNSLGSLNTTLNNVVNCGTTGKTWNGSACVVAGSTVPSGTVCGASSNSTEVGRPLVYSCGGYDPKSGCPAGYSAATVPIWGGKNGQSISYCFKQ